MARSLALLTLCLLPCFTQAATPRVVGGHDANIQQWPYVMHMVSQGVPASADNHYCGGAHIGNGVFVTAAHCIRGNDLSKLWVCVGNSSSANRNNCYAIQQGVIYDGTQGIGDIGLLKAKVPSGWPSMPFASIEEMSGLLDQEPVTGYGYGSTAYGSTYQPSQRLLEYTSRLMSAANCTNMTSHSDSDGMICTERSSTLGAAPGDSGSPLFFQRDGLWKAIALVSDGNNYVVSYQRYDLYFDWIATQLQRWFASPVQLDPVAAFALLPDHAASTRLLRVQNLTNTPRTLHLALNDSSGQFRLSPGCETIAPLGSCQTQITFTPLDGSDNAKLTADLLLDDVKLQTLSVKALSHEVLPAQAGVPAIYSETTTAWSSEAASATADYHNGVFDDQPLAMTVTGPRYMTFKLAVDSLSNGGSVGLYLDDALQMRLSGHCPAQSYQVAIPTGEHRVEWRQEEFSRPDGLFATHLSDVAVQENATASSEPNCSYQSKSESAPSDAVDDSSGGGSVSWLVLLGLAVCRVWRRGSYHGV